MRLNLNRSALLALAVLMAAPLFAAEDGAKKKKDKDKGNNAVAKAFELPTTITLSEEQNTKLAEVKKELEPKLAAVAKKRNDLLTAEQKTARTEAMKAAKAAGKKGKEAQADIAAAVKLTDEQKKKQAEIDKEFNEVTGQIKEKISAFLTADQKLLLKDKKKKKDA